MVMLTGAVSEAREGCDAMKDEINHPSHYEGSKIECIDAMIEGIGEEYVKGFCLGNAFKYIFRCMKKHDTPLADVKKARWYLDKFIELEERQDE